MVLIEITPILTETEIKRIHPGYIGLIKNNDREFPSVLYSNRREKTITGKLESTAILFEVDNAHCMVLKNIPNLVASNIVAMRTKQNSSRNRLCFPEWEDLTKYRKIWIQRPMLLKGAGTYTIGPPEMFLSEEIDRLHKIRENIGGYNFEILQAIIRNLLEK